MPCRGQAKRGLRAPLRRAPSIYRLALFFPPCSIERTSNGRAKIFCYFDQLD
ncbi:hypothetical protein PoB_007017300, partial [Plakobranchus ocellatus]